jgi:hypothetical protein
VWCSCVKLTGVKRWTLVPTFHNLLLQTTTVTSSKDCIVSHNANNRSVLSFGGVARGVDETIELGLVCYTETLSGTPFGDP